MKNFALICLLFFALPAFSLTVPVVNYTNKCFCVSDTTYPAVTNLTCHQEAAPRIAAIYKDKDGNQTTSLNPGETMNAPIFIDPSSYQSIGIRQPGNHEYEFGTVSTAQQIRQQTHYIVLEYYNSAAIPFYQRNQSLLIDNAYDLNQFGCQIPGANASTTTGPGSVAFSKNTVKVYQQ
ncbi:MAG: hypothetical protein KAS93_01430 [Gammaproteobacteria bacterium]|nr:hypothetical protein [Gammaproteobacteria bacterium]